MIGSDAIEQLIDSLPDGLDKDFLKMNVLPLLKELIELHYDVGILLGALNVVLTREKMKELSSVLKTPDLQARALMMSEIE